MECAGRSSGLTAREHSECQLRGAPGRHPLLVPGPGAGHDPCAGQAGRPEVLLRPGPHDPVEVVVDGVQVRVRPFQVNARLLGGGGQERPGDAVVRRHRDELVPGGIAQPLHDGPGEKQLGGEGVDPSPPASRGAA